MTIANKNLLLAAFGFAAIFSFNQALASSYYAGVAGNMIFSSDVEVKAGSSTNKADLKSGLKGGSAFVGLRTDSSVRVELEELYLNTSVKDEYNDKTKLYTTFANAYYDMNVAQDVDVYAGAGVGISIMKLKSVNGNDSDTGLAWQGRVGAAYHVSNELALFTDYTYMVPRFKVSTNNGNKVHENFKFHQASIGLAYNF
jgi:opacity protein-like surface antigen